MVIEVFFFFLVKQSEAEMARTVSRPCTFPSHFFALTFSTSPQYIPLQPIPIPAFPFLGPSLSPLRLMIRVSFGLSDVSMAMRRRGSRAGVLEDFFLKSSRFNTCGRSSTVSQSWLVEQRSFRPMDGCDDGPAFAQDADLGFRFSDAGNGLGLLLCLC